MFVLLTESKMKQEYHMKKAKIPKDRTRLMLQDHMARKYQILGLKQFNILV